MRLQRYLSYVIIPLIAKETTAALGIQKTHVKMSETTEADAAQTTDDLPLTGKGRCTSICGFPNPSDCTVILNSILVGTAPSCANPGNQFRYQYGNCSIAFSSQNAPVQSCITPLGFWYIATEINTVCQILDHLNPGGCYLFDEGGTGVCVYHPDFQYCGITNVG